MNRREAIAALTALPAVTAIRRAEIQPTDVIVVECDHPVTDAVAARIRDLMRDIWPGRKVVVCEQGLRIKVVQGD